MIDKQGKKPLDSAGDGSVPGKSRDPSSSDPTLDRPTQGRIGDQLRAMYDDLLNQLDGSAIGHDAPLRVLRGSRELTLTVRPQEQPTE